MMIELHRFATVKAEATRVGRLTGPAEIVSGEATQEGLEALYRVLEMVMEMSL